MTHYGIIGGGKHSANVIQDGLKDAIKTDDSLYVFCRTGASDSEKHVYDWILDNNIPFTAVTNGKVPNVLIEAADYFLDGTPNPYITIIKELSAHHGTLLVIWDDEQSENIGKLVLSAHDMGIEVLELSNGLAPILIEGDAPKEEASSVETEEIVEVEVEPLTSEDLSNMPVATLKKAAFAQGINDANEMSKPELVSALASPKAVTDDLMGILVYYERGTLRTLELPDEVVAQLLGRC